MDQNDQAVGRLRQRRSYVKWTQRALDHLLAVSYANAATVHLRFVFSSLCGSSHALTRG